jgi:hypothetical protein
VAGVEDESRGLPGGVDAHSCRTGAAIDVSGIALVIRAQ